jgi:hypothetical protein
MWNLRLYDFVIQFCWQPKPRGDRLKAMAEEKTQEGDVPSTAAVEDGSARDSS